MSPHRLAGLLMGCTLLAGCGEWVEVEVEEGYRGEARRKPFLAARRLLESRGWQVEEWQGAARLPPHDRVIVLTPRHAGTSLQTDALQSWIEEGGHVVYLMSGFEPRLALETGTGDGNEKRERERQREILRESFEEEKHPLLERFGLEPAFRPEPTEACRVRGQRLGILMPAGAGVVPPGTMAGKRGMIRSEDANGLGVLSLPFEKGRLTVLGDARIWWNRNIGTLRHATLFWELIRLHGEPSGLWFLNGMDLSFFSLLWEYGWMPLTALGLFVMSWLWRSIPRFGPLLPPPAPAVRDFTGHLVQAGAFLWNRGGPVSLVEPLRRSILRNLNRVRGETGPDDLTAEQWASLARATGLSVGNLREALLGKIPGNRQGCVELLSTLQKIALSIP